jgi:ADP-ribose pyrophosphatase YjhB (NUDIX family)
MKPDFYYLETDGQVFLVKDRNRFRFPRTRKEIPCPFKTLSVIPLENARVAYCYPSLQCHPEHWFHKDKVIGRPEIDPVVQQAVNRTLPRAAAKVAIVENGKVLMVKASRGITRGMWNLPGGFIGYGEHPSESARREVWEEVGTRVKLVRLLGVYADTFKRTGGYMISFIYLGKRQSKTLKANPGEIAEIRWIPVRQAIRDTRNPFAARGLRDYLNRSSSV